MYQYREAMYGTPAADASVPLAALVITSALGDDTVRVPAGGMSASKGLWLHLLLLLCVDSSATGAASVTPLPPLAPAAGGLALHVHRPYGMLLYAMPGMMVSACLRIY